MNRPRLVAAALAVGVVLTGQAGVALADDPSATASSSPSAGPSASPSASPSGGTTPGDATASESPSGSPSGSPSASPTPNKPPVTAPDTASVDAGKTVTTDVLANDSDPDAGPQPLTLATVDDTRARIVNGQVTFTAGAQDSGTVTVTYTVTDGEASATGTLTVTITPPARSVGLTVPDRLVALKKYTLTGRVLPTTLGRPTVTVQRRKGDSWVAWGNDRADAAGRYAVPFRTNQPVTFVLRAKAVWPDGKVRYSGTRKRAITVVADPVVSGPLTRSQVPWSYRAGCPVPPSGLRKVTINRIDYHHLVARGTLVVRASVAQQMVSVFTAAVDGRFPVKSMHPTDYYYDHGRRTPTQSDEAAMRAGNTAAFNCRPVTGNPYRISQHSYGNAIDINTVENPYVTGSRVYPSFAREYLDRSPYRKGMILRGGVIASRMAQLGWPWGARWSHPDYQHFSSNGG